MCLKAAQVIFQRSPKLGCKEISMITKTQFLNAVFTPTLLYQSENWTVTSKEISIITKTHILNAVFTPTLLYQSENWTITSKEISIITKTHILNAVFTPTLLYQSENWTITSKEISIITKTHILNAVFTPTLLYQSENWTITSKERQMLTTTEMRCLRKAAGKTRMDKIRNEDIRRRVNMQPAEQTANKNKIMWWSQIKRMAPTEPQIKAFVIQPE